MRYAFFIDKLKNGGAERVATILANHFSLENEVYLFVVDDSQIDYYLEPSIRIIKVPYDDNKIKRMVLRKSYINKQIKDIGFDACITLTYTFLPYILTSPRSKRGKVISSLRNAPQYEITSRIGRILRWIGFSLCDYIVFQTPDARDYFSKNISNKGVVIPNPIAENLPMVSDVRRKCVVMATRLEKQKNIPLAIDAFKLFHRNHSDWTMEIYGRGTLQDDIEEKIKIEGLKECIHLNEFSKDIHEIVSHCGMFLLSSDFEGLSNSMIEAMAIGVPVICTDCPIGGAKMMIMSGTNGILVPVGEVKKMAEAMSTVADNSDYANKIGKKAREIRISLQADVICEKWYHLVK